MRYAKFDLGEKVAEFFSKPPAKKMYGVACDTNGIFHVFYDETFVYSSPCPEEGYGCEEDEE